MNHLLLATRSLALAILVLAAQPVRAEDDCDAPSETWQPRSAVHALAERNGWRIDKLKIDDGCYEIKGRDADDRRFKAKLDPATLKVVRMKREHGDRERERERRHGTPPGTPPVAKPAAGIG
ncbi:PepSY domain-containing protein [Variovorax paradoxus B4]|uniref:PepSY domain-containing protein n=1 Tax=Variovorax paradoxus B4 TaxID=1246301 RepID=T1XK11_VARPD|nr:PepSY domain-containing protein [Variovorax paradoxus]AGU53207.1 PepSY domain-containing protein [Variovorax paradoxus B4]